MKNESGIFLMPNAMSSLGQFPFSRKLFALNFKILCLETNFLVDHLRQGGDEKDVPTELRKERKK